MSDQTPTTAGNEAQAAADASAGAPAAASAVARPSAFDRASYAAPSSRGYGSAMSRGLELAITLVLMVGIGWLADRTFGTSPLFTIVFSIFGFAGISVKLWLGYDLEMRKQEAGAIWNRESKVAS